MAEFPKEGRFEYGKMDQQTGAQWVYVTPDMARAHPQGKLNAALWAIATVFVALGLLKLAAAVSAGFAFILVLGGAFQLLTGVMLAMRAPYAVLLAGAQLLITLFGTVTSGMMGELFQLGVLIFSAGSLFYLTEGDRPNLIYRHRYRSFRGKSDAGDSGGPAA